MLNAGGSFYLIQCLICKSLSVFGRRHIRKALENPTEIVLIVQADSLRYSSHGKIGVNKHLLCLLYSYSDEIVFGTRSHYFGKQMGKSAFTKVTYLRK